MRYKCIIFDCDGVLVDSESLSNRVLINLAKDLEIELTEEFVEENYSGKKLTTIFAHLESLSGKTLPETFEKEYRQQTFELFKTELLPIPGIIQVLKNLSTPCCVASNGPLNKMEMNLKNTGLLHFFEGNIFSAYEIKSWKPSPKLFLHAAGKMGYQPSECLVIEDSLSGIQAAKSGGFDVFAFTSPDNKEKFQNSGAKKTFHHMDQLEKLIMDEA